MVTCKNCHDTHTVKNGFVRAKQRYKCKLCGYNFVLGDERYSQATEVKKALCLILYSLRKSLIWLVGQTLRGVTHHHLLLDSTSRCEHR